MAAAAARECLNCGATLTGKFCGNCGQRALPPYPTVREMIGDAWHELSGWDGRFLNTFRALFRRPGRLTRDVLEGRRARYIAPVRLYLVASLAYFVLAAGAPAVRVADASGNSKELKIGVWGGSAQSGSSFTPEEQAEMDRLIAKSHWFIRPLLESARHDEAGIQRKALAAMPKVLFALVPIFGGILAVFFWRRPFTQHLTFSLHLHTAVFLVLGVVAAIKYGESVIAAVTAGLTGALFIPVYGVRALREVYGGRWRWVILKGIGIATAYAMVAMPLIFVVIATIAFVTRP